jgi:hypothetical protein
MVTAFDVPLLESLDGDSDALSGYSARYAAVAEAISAVSRQLDLIADDDVTIGLSVDVMRDEAGKASDSILEVLPRYSETAAAIRDYAVVLADAQSRADGAIAEAETLRNELFALYDRRSRAENDFQSQQYAATADTLQDIAGDLNSLQTLIDARESRLHAVWMSYLDADGDKSDAAYAAARRIAPAVLGSNDSIFDWIKAGWDAATHFVAVVTEWVAGVLYDVLFTLMLVQVALVALVLVLAFALPLAIGLATGWIALDDLIAIAIVVIPALAGLVGIVMAIEALRPAPPMRPVKPYWGTEVDKADRTDYEQAFFANGEIDTMGGTDETVVDITKVVDAEGNVTWRVTLPSTQDWQVYFDWWDQGAANDLGSNLALILTPGQQAAYERMVIDAMHQAGIGPTDEVMLVGFSQGGILAGKLAATPDLPFTVKSVVVGGAPIDHMDIPSDVAVLSFQHSGDVVPRLDGTPPVDHGPNWITVVEDPQPNQAEHGAISYSHTAAEWTPDTEAEQAVVAQQSEFFSDNETSYLYSGHE